jgi:hypothetical protein
VLVVSLSFLDLGRVKQVAVNSFEKLIQIVLYILMKVGLYKKKSLTSLFHTGPIDPKLAKI